MALINPELAGEIRDAAKTYVELERDRLARERAVFQITEADRVAAWSFRPECYREADKQRWHDGVYDETANVIRAFATHRLEALERAGAVVDALGRYPFNGPVSRLAYEFAARDIRKLKTAYPPVTETTT